MSLSNKITKLNCVIITLLLLALLLLFSGNTVNANTPPKNNSPKLSISAIESTTSVKGLTVEEFKTLFSKNNRIIIKFMVTSIEEDVEIGAGFIGMKYDDTLFKPVSASSNKTYIEGDEGPEQVDIWNANIVGTELVFNSNVGKTDITAPKFQKGVAQYIATVRFELVSGKTLDDITNTASLEFGIEYLQFGYSSNHTYSNDNITTEDLTIGEIVEEPNPSIKSIEVLGGNSGEIVLDAVNKFTSVGSNIFETTISLLYADSKKELNFKRVELNNANATYEISGNNGNITQFKVGDVVTITTTHLGVNYTYKIKIGSIGQASADNALAGLTAKYPNGSNLITNFNSNTKSYNVTIPSSQSSITIEALLPSTSFASVKIDNENITGVKNGNNLVFTKTISNLIEGQTKAVNVVVTAENGSQNTYTVNVTREKKSSVNTLSSLTLKILGKSSIIGNITGDMITATIPEYDKNGVLFDIEMVPTDSTVTGIKYRVNGGSSFNATYSNGKYIVSSVYNISRGGEVNISIDVTAQDGSIKTYTLIVTREKSSNTEISKIDLSQNNITTTANRSGSNFTYNSSGNGKITIYPVLPTGEASSFVIRKGSSSGENITSKPEVDPTTLVVGSNLFYITVTAENGTATAEYILDIVVRSKENNLISNRLYESNNPSNEFIEWEETDVQRIIRIPWTKNNLKVDLKLESSPKSKISVTSYNPSATIVAGATSNIVTITYQFIGIEEQELPIIITVAAEDPSFVQTYNITVIREKADGESRLSKLTVNSVDVPNFSPDTYVYPETIIVDRSLTEVQVYAVKHENSKADVTITYNGNTTGIIELNPLGGDPKIVKIVVTAQSGAKSEYTIKIVAGSTSTDIFNVEFSGINSFTFYPATYNYTIEAPASLSSTVMRVTTQTPYLMKVYIDGVHQPTATKTITLNEGVNKVQVYVVSEAGTLGKVYTFEINRAKASNHKLLENLEVRVDGKVQTLIPVSGSTTGFNPEIFDYKLRVDYNVTSVYITATLPTGKNSTLIFENGKKDLIDTKTTFTITVEAEDKTKNYYTVEVTRADDNNNVLKVIVAGVEYDISEFVGNPGDVYKVLTITEQFPYATTNLKLSFVLENQNAKIVSSNLTADNTWVLNDGENILEFYAISQAGTVGQKYRIKVSRAPANSDTSLKTLKVKNGSIDFLSNLFDSSLKQAIYNIRIDTNINILNIEAVANGVNAKVTVTPSTSIEIKERNTTITVDVVAESGAIGKHTIYVTRANDDYKLYGINIDDNPLVDKNGQGFNQSILEYTLANVLYSKNSITFNFDIENNAKVYVNDVLVSKTYTHNLKEGNNLIKIQVQSDYGTYGSTYKINIYREYASDDNNLTGIKVNGVSVLDFDQPTPGIIYLTPGVTFATITVEGLPQGATVTYNGKTSNVVELNGTNLTTITVTVKSEKGTERNYILRVTSANRDNTITGITLSRITGNNEIKTPFVFDKDTYVYNITVPYTIDYTLVTVTAPNAKIVYGNGRVDLLTDGINEITIYAVSESGETGKVYTIKITREAPSSDAFLEKLEVLKDGINYLEGFEKTKLTYTLRFDNNITNLDIAYLAPKGATVSGDLGHHVLTQKVTTLKITVTAEDKVTIKTYTIVVYKTNDNKNVNDILVGEDLNSIVDANTGFGFNKEVLKYTLSKVPYTQNKLKLQVVLEDPSAKVTINNVPITSEYDVNLKEGKNTITVVVKSEYEVEIGGAGITYTIEIERDKADTNNTLTGISVNGIDVINFDSINSETVILPSGTKNATITVRGLSPYSTITYDGSTSNVIRLDGNKEKTVIIRVTAQNGSSRDYYVYIQAVDTNNEIEKIEFIGIGNDLFTFEKNVYSYSFKVPYSVTSLTANVTLPNGSKATITGNGRTELVASNGYDNIIVIYATSEAGVAGQKYTIYVQREKASNRTDISSLQIYKSNTQTPGTELLDPSKFDPEADSYEIRVDNDTTAVYITATPIYNATIANTGRKGLSKGTNNFTLVVTAEDGITTRSINIKIVCLNDNNNIKDIAIDGNSYDIVSKDTYDVIYLNSSENPYPYSKKSIDISGTLEDSYAKLYIDGVVGLNQTVNLKEGMNTIKVYAESEYGTKGREIHIIYYRMAAASDTTLEDLYVEREDGVIIPFDETSFSPTKEAYIITLKEEDNFSKVRIVAVGENLPYKEVTGNLGLQALNWVGNSLNQKFVINVKAENGSNRTYSITIIKNSSLNSNTAIKSLTVKDSSGKNYIDFIDDGVVNRGKIILPYSISTLIYNIETDDRNASVVWENGNVGANSFVPGTTVTVYFYVLAQDGTKGTKYYFEVTRQLANSIQNLSTLSVKDSTNTEYITNFNSETRVYNIRVDNAVDKVIVNASVLEGSNAKIVSGLGEYQLTSGEVKEIKIFVLAEDGSMDKPYTIYIKRANNNASISSVVVDGVELDLSKDFVLDKSSGRNVYVYQHKNVSYSKEFMQVDVTPEDIMATVYGGGIVGLKLKNNTFTFYVLAQDKETRSDEYRIEVYREEASNDTILKNLELYVDGVNVINKFSSSTYVYEVCLTRDNLFGNIVATKNHEGQLITGDLNSVSFIPGQVNEYRIVVTAENKIDSETYTIRVTVKNNNSDIKKIEVKDQNNNPILLSPNFSKDVKNYTLGSLGCHTSKLKLDVLLEDTFGSFVILVNGEKINNPNACELKVGINEIVVYGVGEDGTIGTQYTITLEREPFNDNTEVVSIIVRENNAYGNILEGGDITVVNGQNQYTIYIGSSSPLTSVYVGAIALESTTTISGLGIHALNPTGATSIKLLSTAESGDTAEYIITIVRGGKGDNETPFGISKVELFDDKMNNYFKNFNPDLSVQTPIAVPYGVSKVLLVVVAYPGLDIIGNGTYELTLGEQTSIEFGVTDGEKTQTYTVQVTRLLPTSDNALLDFYIEVVDSNNQTTRIPLDPNLDLNQVSVGSNTNQITIGGIKPSNSTVSGFGTYEIKKDVEFYRVVVSSLYGPDKEYIIQVNRKDNNTEFASIKVDGVEKLGQFNNYVLDLGTVPYRQTSLEISAIALSETSKVNGTSNAVTIEYALSKVGPYEFTLYVLAQDGTIGPQYTIRLTREAADNNANLQTLTVINNHTKESLLLMPTFSSQTTKYSIDLTYLKDVSEIKIDAVAQSENATIKGLGTYVLKTETGQTTQVYTVDVTAEDEITKKVYEITIIREVNPDDDNTINDISLIGSDAVNYLGIDNNAKTKFELSKYEYQITVPYKVKNVTLYISNDNGATPYGIGRYEIKDKVTTIEFYMVSKSKIESKKYKVVITQEDPSSNNLLEMININGKPLSDFDPNRFEYTVNVISEKVSKITLDAIKSDNNSIISGDLGEITLPHGKTQWKINVQAEDGTFKTYIINVNRLSGNNNIIDISVDGWDLTPTFAPDKLVYRLTVPYATSTVTLRATPEVSTATIVGIGLKQLAVGSNYMTIYATAENGDKGTIYQVEVIRENPSTDSSLKSLEVYEYNGGPAIEFSPAFSPTTLSYIINLPADANLNSVYIDAIANSPVARGVSGTGFKWLKADIDGKYHSVLEIIVIAEDGVTTTTYTISIYRDVNLSKDITIGELSLIGSNGINYLGTASSANISFNSNTYQYQITVPYNLASITLNVQTLSASVYGVGTKTFGTSNTIQFVMYVVSQDKTARSQDYIITVTKEAAQTNNKLKSLLINDDDLLSFDPDTMQYEITLSVHRYKSILISAIPEDNRATVSGDLLPVQLKEGKQTFTILCTSESGDIRTYTIIVNYVQSNALLQDLQIYLSDADKYDPNTAQLFKGLMFDPETFEYTLKVEKNIKYVNISGAAQDIANALVLGFGTYKVEDSGNKILIFVQSADGKYIEKYTVNITREDIPCNNSKLKNLIINGGQYKLTFDPNICHYTLNVKNGVKKLDVEAIAQDLNAKVEIEGAEDIENGKNIVLIKVTAEDGTQTYYQLNVMKDNAPDYFLLVMVIITFLLWLLTVLYFFIFYKKHKNGKHRPVVI